MKPVRVTHLIGQLGRGGSERQLFLTLSHLDPARIDSDVVVFNPSPHEVYDDALRDKGTEVRAIPPSVRSIPRRVTWLRRHLRARASELVHSWSYHDNPYAALSGRLAGAEAYWGSLRGVPGAAAASLSRPAMWLSLHAVQRLVVNTRQLERRLIRQGLPPERILLLPNCVEDSRGHPSDTSELADLPFPPGIRLIGSIGNLRRVKNHEMFVRALATLLPRHPDVAAVIVGQELPSEPGVASRLVAQIESVGLSHRIRLLGFRDDVPAVLQRLQALCLTSLSEGTPNVILEAMVAGCPVAATNVGGIPDLVTHETTGLLVPSGDAVALAEALERLLTDESLSQELAANARSQVVATRSCQRVASQLTEEYERATARSGR